MSKVIMNDGAGGDIMQEFISKHITSHFPRMKTEIPLDALDDSAVVDDIVFTIDGHTVNPLFFPGGDIGRIAVSGTVNDISVMGAKPVGLGSSVILEEGLDSDTVDKVMESMGKTSQECGVPVVTGDTKVMGAGELDKMIITTSAIGIRPDYLDHDMEVANSYRKVDNRWCADSNTRPGDVIIVSGYMGDHGIALLSFREGYGFESDVKSDVQPLNKMIEKALRVGGIVAMKDPTRGGLANTLNEWADKSKCQLDVNEADIPIRDGVENACELLGIEPLNIGNEGKCVISVVPEMAEEVLKALRATPEGKDAAIIGRAVEGPSRVVLKTEIGGKRILEPPSGDPVPRIC
ncbi:MAG: hydrogenase expression/formation protein HypE [Candidatus Methanomethylophilus sp.]|nr:hydrogenase expression/formation protein HypE [methanogenic archaeon ISO4-H5]MBO5519658.1 hydrogenase expression/formation protein HypE [Methanomethylophilus sp.]MBO5599475.1 hydrogenase expression/formation protein HypE [Methanomethylophilus sp.]MEE3478343.1 hydrogenase expression/formation protein HypE [Methanomethylophilus sp.]